MLPVFKPTFLDTPDATQQYTYVTTIGNRCYLRGRDATGAPSFVERDYTPTYYLPTQHYQGHASYDGQPLEAHSMPSIRAGRDWLKDNPNAYGNIQCEYMLLADVYGQADIVPDMERLLIWNIDIETPGERFASVTDPFNPVSTITVKKRHMGQSETVVYGLQAYTPADGVTFVQCADEKDLLTTFLRDWRNKGNYPDIVTGWNIQFFDIPYLVNRMTRLGYTEKDIRRLSPFNDLSVREAKANLYNTTETVVDIRGVAILDYLELYRKFTFTQRESYRLDHIAHVELNRRKISYTEHQTLDALYQQDYQTFVDYNIQDVELVDALDEKLKFIELVCALAYSAKANYVDTFRIVRWWDIATYHYLRAQGKQIPPKPSAKKDEQFVGAYVKDPQVGDHKWVCSFDINSLYPHIIRQWNLSPETLTGLKMSAITLDALLAKEDVTSYLASGDHVPDGYALSANGVLTRRDAEGFLPAMLRELYDKRKQTQRLMKEKRQELELVKQEMRRRRGV